ncbi:Mce protein [Mycobacterium sp. 236(2023)]|uniref:Mce protein n=1 Tax=Mycobacterium sp. 236(2023) TaxID=3038163 RepID=UPI0024158AC7|nr:Mce protein [Mycobacterium sp. 236(2023)]MDG4668060.1 Mce protein [Mycobacterium sp. 236(2023)]
MVRRRRADRLGLVVVTLIVVSLAGLVGWQATQVSEARKDQEERAIFLQVARQGALNLTTISHATAEQDVQRILDSSAGTFRDDFELRAQPFIDAVKNAQSTTTGSITEAGLEAQADGSAEAIVAVAVKTSIADAAEQETRSWRMRVALQRTDSGVKVVDVEFVP